MPRTLISALALSTALAAAASAQDGEYLDYPETATVDQVDTYQTPDGTEEVADPYRWLEDSVRTNPDVAAWVAAQNAWASSSPPGPTVCTTAVVASTATVTESMVSSGSPHTSPTESQSWARPGG